MKQTSIEWLEEKLKISFGVELTSLRGFFDQAKEMHKQEIKDAAERWKKTDFAERYYEETFGSKDMNGNEIEFTQTLKEMVDQVPDVRKMVKDDVEKLAENNDWEEHIWDDDVNKIAENVFPYDTHRTDYATEECRRIFILGFEKAKENLYTEEQVKELLYSFDLEIKKHLLNYRIEHSLHGKICDGINDVRNNYIQSLKQPKQ